MNKANDESSASEVVTTIGLCRRSGTATENTSPSADRHTRATPSTLFCSHSPQIRSENVLTISHLKRWRNSRGYVNNNILYRPQLTRAALFITSLRCLRHYLLVPSQPHSSLHPPHIASDD